MVPSDNDTPKLTSWTKQRPVGAEVLEPPQPLKAENPKLRVSETQAKGSSQSPPKYSDSPQPAQKLPSFSDGRTPKIVPKSTAS